MADSLFIRNTSEKADEAIARYQDRNGVSTKNAAVCRMLEEYWELYDKRLTLQQEMNSLKYAVQAYLENMAQQQEATQKMNDALESITQYSK